MRQDVSVNLHIPDPGQGFSVGMHSPDLGQGSATSTKLFRFLL